MSDASEEESSIPEETVAKAGHGRVKGNSNLLAGLITQLGPQGQEFKKAIEEAVKTFWKEWDKSAGKKSNAAASQQRNKSA